MKDLLRTKSVDALVQDAGEGGGVHSSPSGLKRSLGVWDLTSFGIAAVIGAGIFSTIGNASFHGGPGVSLLFIFTAIACGFSAFCYAEFASTAPVSGSAYSYAYASLGELVAWIIGWDLLMEYAIGNIAVAISWSDYFTSLLAGYGIDLPRYLTMDFLTANRGYDAAQTLLTSGMGAGLSGAELGAQLTANGLSNSQWEAFLAWSEAPRIFGFPLVCDLPAMVVVVLVTWIVYIGIQESKRVSNIMVLVKMAVLLLVIGLGAFYVRPENWTPFMPNGMSGVLKGVSAVFFAYIGFDAISTTAEECRNPQRDLPRAMIYALIICTLLYIAVALVLTGMVNHTKLEVGDPLAYVFGPEGANIPWISAVVAVSAVVALFTVLLVFQLGQPRIWMAMSRDGLLPPIFSAIHPKYKTPWFSTVLTGVVVAVPSLFMNLTEVTDLTSIGTLFAFVIVCAGVLKFDPKRPKIPGKFRVPYINGRWLYPGLLLIAAGALWTWNREACVDFFVKFHADRIPLAIFCVGVGVVAVLAFRKSWSLIPLLGMTSCLYLMTELGLTNWIRFGIWLVVGLAVYFLYSAKHSRLSRSKTEPRST